MSPLNGPRKMSPLNPLLRFAYILLFGRTKSSRGRIQFCFLTYSVQVYGFVQLLFGRGQVRMGFLFFCNILSFCWHLLHSYHCLERLSQVSIYFVYCCSERPSQVKRVFSSFLATFSILFFRSNIFSLFRCTYLKIVVWLDKIK